MYESTPQLCFQLYILLSSLKPSWTASISMITSALSLSVPNIEKFLHSRGKVDIWNILKYLPIFFFNSIFKVASLSIIFVFFKVLSLAFFPLHVILNIMFGARMKRNHFLLNETSNDLNQQGCEVLLSCFTTTNLQHTRVAGLYRLQNTYLCLVTKSLILITIAAICNIAPDTVTVPSITGGIISLSIKKLAERAKSSLCQPRLSQSPLCAPWQPQAVTVQIRCTLAAPGCQKGQNLPPGSPKLSESQ